jgi:hypothetical protein
MPGTITLSSTVQKIKGGGTITYKGNANRCIWWELVGVDANVEGAAFGALSNTQDETDTDGYATAIYTAPTANLDPDQWDRVKVHESMAV